MPGLGIQTAFEPGQDEKASSGLPSPTLTNPDMVLPSNDDHIKLTPNRSSHYNHSWSNNPTGHPAQQSHGTRNVNRGPRNMILVPTRPGLNGPNNYSSSAYLSPQNGYSQRQQESDAMSVSSVNSDDLAGLPAYLAKYKKQSRANGDTNGDNDESSDTDTTVAPTEDGYSASVIENDVGEQRKEQEKHERASAILSQRAEQILANAKQRLNLMEGNLRGARDLVAPLTAANLKRATSMYAPYSSNYLAGIQGTPDKVSNAQMPSRTLQGHISSPSMNRDFQGHARGFSETKLPERTHTSMTKSTGITRSGRIPINVNVSWNQGVRASKSFDSVGNPLQPNAPSPKVDPSDSTLKSVKETSENRPGSSHSRSGSIYSTTSSASTVPEHLRSQMSSLQERVSSLKERAAEDRLKRQSLRSSKSPSPFNNANITKTELLYASKSESQISPRLEINGEDAWNASGRTESPSMRKSPDPTSSGSRNAFAEQAAHGNRYSGNSFQFQMPEQGFDQVSFQSQDSQDMSYATAPVETQTNRYSQQQGSNAEQEPTSYLHDESEYDQYSDVESLLDDASGVMGNKYMHHDADDFDDPTPADGISVYEDAEDEIFTSGVAHEDRHDAFDYERFFLHSAMGNFSNGRRDSSSSEESNSSVETARNPRYENDDEDDDEERSNPRTPERLKEIERSLHRRTESSDSINTLATFATAAEHRATTPSLSRRTSSSEWPINQPRSRPGTAIGMAARNHTMTQNGIRIDSGVIIPRRPNSAHDLKRAAVLKPRSSIGMLASPPMSPNTTMADPAAIAANAIMHPNNISQLGLKDKSLLFGVIESLRKVCASLQEQPHGQPESQSLRRRLEEAKRALDGVHDSSEENHLVVEQ